MVSWGLCGPGSSSGELQIVCVCNAVARGLGEKSMHDFVVSRLTVVTLE